MSTTPNRTLPRLHRACWPVLAASLAILGCTEPPTAARPAEKIPPLVSVPLVVAETLAAIVINPAEVSIEKGETRQFAHAGLDQNQKSIASGGGAWSVVPGTGTAAISEAGLLTALTPGSVIVRYTVGAVVGTAAATVTPSRLVHLVIDGASNSIESTWPPTLFARPELAGWSRDNVSVSGQTITQMASDFDSQVVPLMQPGKRNIYFASSGPSNQFTGGSGGVVYTGAEVFAKVEALAVRAKAAGFEVWVATMLDRTQVLGPLSQTQLDAARLELNALLRGMVAKGTADVIIDWASVPELGAVGAANNSVYFSDGIHTTRAGQGLVIDRLLTDGVNASRRP